MITSASAHLDSVCCMTVLPAPKGPGMAAVPPWATGKRTSMMRCPVTSGSRGSKRWTSGREKRTGQVCMSRSSRPSSSRPTTSVTRTAPPRISLTRARAASGGPLVPDLYCGREGPPLLPVQGDGAGAPLDEVSLLLADVLQGALDAVENAEQQPWPQFHGQGLPGGLSRLADVQARGVLVDLDKGGIAVEADDLPDQPLIADAHNVVHPRAGHAAGDDRRAGNLDDSACDGHVHPPSTPALPPPPTAEGPEGPKTTATSRRTQCAP